MKEREKKRDRRGARKEGKGEGDREETGARNYYLFLQV